MANPKMTPEEKARADAYAAGVFSEREHTTRALGERDEARGERDAALARVTALTRDYARVAAELSNALDRAIAASTPQPTRSAPPCATTTRSPSASPGPPCPWVSR